MNFGKKSGTCQLEVSVSSTNQECNDVTTPYTVSDLLTVKWLLTGNKFQTFILSGRDCLYEVITYEVLCIVI